MEFLPGTQREVDSCGKDTLCIFKSCLFCPLFSSVSRGVGGGGWGLGEEEGAKSSQEDEGEAQQRSYRSNTAAGAQDCKNKQTKTNKKIKI